MSVLITLKGMTPVDIFAGIFPYMGSYHLFNKSDQIWHGNPCGRGIFKGSPTALHS